MHLDFHELRFSPFENTPDPRFFFGAEDHREALANIVYALRTGKGLVMITGEIGSGKTMLCHTLRDRADRGGQMIVIRQAPASGRQLLRAIARELGLNPTPDADRTDLLADIEAELTRRRRSGRAVLLVIDEAQDLGIDVLDEVRHLSNIETSTEKLAQIVLLGQSNLRLIMQDPRLAALRQRVALTHHLGVLTAEQTDRYLSHRLRIAARGDEPVVGFTPDAGRLIHGVSGGTPRLINLAADHCLLAAFVRGTHTIDGSIVDEATQHLFIPDSRATDDHGAPVRQAA